MFAQDLLANQRRDNTTLALRYTEHNLPGSSSEFNLVLFTPRPIFLPVECKFPAGKTDIKSMGLLKSI